MRPPRISSAFTRCAVLIRSGSLSSTVIAAECDLRPRASDRERATRRRRPRGRRVRRAGSATRRGQDQHGGGQRGEPVAVLDQHVRPQRRDQPSRGRAASPDRRGPSRSRSPRCRWSSAGRPRRPPPSGEGDPSRHEPRSASGRTAPSSPPAACQRKKTTESATRKIMPARDPHDEPAQVLVGVRGERAPRCGATPRSTGRAGCPPSR